ncbi:MAG: GNAT family N-acetyltransferase [Planctomycetes bacterium]|nr:GNAT family N-acetyltransferase [Planctomycetota bacterium]
MSSFEVSRAAGHELLPACRLLFAEGAEPRAARLRADADASAVFVARGAGRVCAAALVQAMPGALGVAWAPRGDSTEAVDAATVAACDWLRARGAKVCQAFAPASERDAMAPLERAGFRHTTQLVFLRRELSAGCFILSRPPRPFTLVQQVRPFSERFAAILVATHDGTGDCPELNAGRSGTELLEGFGGTERTLWHLAEHDGAGIGVIVTEVDPATAVAELTYIGIVPSYRGRGYGTDLLYLAMAGVATQHGRELTLSVDARNAPALRLYARHGFVECDRREVWLATWSASGAA